MINQASPVQQRALQRVKVGDVWLAYRESGAGGEAVVLIHGLCSMSYTWQGVFDLISQHCRTIALDLKGFGASDKPAGDYRLDTQVELVLGLMDQLRIERAVLVGNSLGGAVALRLAEGYSERVARMVLVAPAVYPAPVRLVLLRFLLGSSGSFGREVGFYIFKLLTLSPLFLERRMRVIYRLRSTITPERVATYYSMLRDPACQRAIIATLQAWDLNTVVRHLHLVRQPSLIIWGQQDRILRPKFGQQLVRELPNAELKFLPCGHAPQEEMPAEFARLVIDFLRKA